MKINSLICAIVAFTNMHLAQSHQSGHLMLRGGIGPGWHQLLSYQKYFLTPQGSALNMTSDQETNTRFVLFPYFEASLTGKLRHAIAQVLVSGGPLRGGTASVSGIQTVPGEITIPKIDILAYDAQIVTVDTFIGYEFCTKKAPLLFVPHVGFLFNKDSVTLTSCNKDTEFLIHTSWYSGYIGIIGALTTHEYMLNLQYKIPFGRVVSYLSAKTPPVFDELNPQIIIPSSNPPCSRRACPMTGSFFSFDCVYLYTDTLQFGTGIEYSHYRNRSNGCVSPVKTEYVSKSLLKNITWNQLAWTFFVRYVY